MSEALTLLAQCSALLEGHFKLSSGLHSNRYFQCARAFVDASVSRRLVAMILPQLASLQADMVVGPAMGGILVAYEIASQLGIRNCFTEREEGKMTLRRGFHVEAGSRVLIAEDVVTTGGSSAEVVEVLRGHGASVVALTCVVDRSCGKAAETLKLPVTAVVQMEVPTWQPDACPLCADGVPVVKPGSRPG